MHTSASSPATTICPTCATAVPTTPGFVAWCEECGWNVAPARPHDALTLVGRAFLALGERSGQHLFERLAAAPTLQRQTSLATALTLVAAALVHLGTLGLLIGGVTLLVSTWFSLGPALLAALLLGIAWVLRPRFGQLEGRPLRREEAPALFGLLDRVAAAMEHPPVENLVLDHHINASYSRVGLRDTPVVTLGLPLLAMLGPQQQVALVAHELAHGVNGDLLRGRIVGSAIDALQSWYDLLHPRRVWQPELDWVAYLAFVSNLVLLGLALLAEGATWLLSLLAWRDSQRAEYLADDLAAEVAGTEAAGALLAALKNGGVAELVVQELALGGGQGGLVERLERAMAGLPARERERLRRAALAEGARLDATHPPSALRVAMVARRAHGAATVTLSAEEAAALRAELVALEGPIRAQLAADYRASLYHS